ncbi:calmodulin-binding transcription activator 2-like isoform X1 [Salvia splendens]|uniref:calmodulin-binding transcription activator 2-like isoform X1 n=1 Tax=Salvia splendens TaxID=180675 RepID=UPI001C27B5EE|nr:calmodulin-binding transcription activator 2-like isoform X1 [Salvia splendens]
MAAENRHSALTAHLDIPQILLEAQHRWLRPAEICEILQNYKKFRIAPEAPNRPPNGSLFLFDRKVLRYFRKDGHNWRKKNDGKTVKEAHERLKAGRVDVLHCYYAHGEDNQNFQRRSYWMLEEEMSHIVLVHYREVKGNRTSYSRTSEADSVPASGQSDDVSTSEVDSSAAFRFQSYDYQRTAPITDTTSLNRTLVSDLEDAESAYTDQASSRFQTILDLQSPIVSTTDAGSVPRHPIPVSTNYQGRSSAIPGMSLGPITQGEENRTSMDNGLTCNFQQDIGFSSWGVAESSSTSYQSVDFQLSLPCTQSSAMSMIPGQDNELLDDVFTDEFMKKQEFRNHSDSMGNWQPTGGGSLCMSDWSVDQKPDGNLLSIGQNPNQPPMQQPLLYDLTTKLNDANEVELSDSIALHNMYLTDQRRQHLENDLQNQALNSGRSSLKLEPGGNLNAGDKADYPSLRQPLLDGVMREGLKKLDSFDRWISKELDDVTESSMQPGSGVYWETVGGGGDDSGISTQVPSDNYVLGPSLSKDQLFSIIDFSPNWTYSGSEIKVHVMGRFLRDREVENYKWACMFGELEVLAEIVGDGVLRCITPLHEPGRVPFYITCCNRLACSEVREFEFRASFFEDVNSDETRLYMRFGKILSLGSDTPPISLQSIDDDTSQLFSKISALLNDDTEWEQMSSFSENDEFSSDNVKNQLLEKLLKEKLHNWLIQKIAEGGKGPNVLDVEGLGVLHFAAALGYDWAIPPTVAAGVSVNFRDVNGWTALHWAAYYGREHTVAFLLSFGASPGALTDPTPIHPSGETPADLAASNGHKGIAGYLAESSLSSHLSSLDLKDSEQSDRREKVVETVSERIATPVGADDLPHGLSLKDSLAAVRNATQAAARIHQVFRVQSFQRKQLKECGDSEYGISDGRALSLALESKKSGKRDEPVHSAAAHIQNKFRCWKGRKEFLLIRQQIIKIQAHVRGHQVRKNYKKIIWSVGILDKVILRWRRKGRGLSGFKSEASVVASSSMIEAETKEDDYDFLKAGRKQTEERLQKALARVKSMVQYPEARDQYRRLLNVVSEMQEKKAAQERMLNNPEIDFDEDLIDFEALLEDDIFMPIE